MPKFAAILPAAGRSRRFKDPHYKKPFASLAGKAVWLHAAEKFLNRADVTQLVLVLADEDREEFQRKFAANAAILGIDITIGGEERSDSIQNALEKLNDDVEYVAIHDAARPCLADVWIDRVFEAAQKHGAAMLAIPVAGTLKRVSADQQVEETVSRQGIWEAQTPQVFRRDLICEAYAQRQGMSATDDAQLVEKLGKPVAVVHGSPINLKITTKEDLRLAEQALRALPKPKLNMPSHPFADDDLWR